MSAPKRTTNIDKFLHSQATSSLLGCCKSSKERFQGANIKPHYAKIQHSGARMNIKTTTDAYPAFFAVSLHILAGLLEALLFR